MSALAVPRVHLIGPLDGVLNPEQYAVVAAQAVRGGVDAVHVRLPGAAGGDIMRLAQEVAEQLGLRMGAALIVNDRVDVAMAIGAAGVHLGERSMTVQQARTLLGPDVLIGRSIHDLAGALRAEADGADYLLAGHVFATGSKPDQPGRGVEWIADLAGNVSVPIIAIGGITRERTEAVLQAGAYGVAMGREILAASDPTAVAREIRSRIEQRGA